MTLSFRLVRFESVRNEQIQVRLEGTGQRQIGRQERSQSNVGPTGPFVFSTVSCCGKQKVPLFVTPLVGDEQGRIAPTLWFSKGNAFVGVVTRATGDADVLEP